MTPEERLLRAIFGTDEETDMQVQQYNRKSFTVEAVQVTAENRLEVAEWCEGVVVTDANGDFIQVAVYRPLNERQTRAFVGDWVLKMGSGFKIYNDRAFHDIFELSASEIAADELQDSPEVVAELERRDQEVVPQDPKALIAEWSEHITNLVVAGASRETLQIEIQRSVDALLPGGGYGPGVTEGGEMIAMQEIPSVAVEQAQVAHDLSRPFDELQREQQAQEQSDNQL